MNSSQPSRNEETPLPNPNTNVFVAEASASIKLLLRRTLVWLGIYAAFEMG
ncbi:hypothetical protein WG954_19600 [Lacibacter sp. H375]|uniref:hypothetical protein n=1 Tax=Lacibacter sp. H375 TaxID=3133424 RepID=UPI0030BC77BC